MTPPYHPVDQLFLWWLVQPDQPRLVGELNTARTMRGVSLRYDADWLRHGIALSEDLPLLPQEFLPARRDSAPGAVDDARPDRWGERVIRFVDKPARLSLLEYLYFAGDERFGALGVSTSRERYEPRRLGPLPTLQDAAEIHQLIRKLLDNEPVPQDRRRLITPGVTMGGARPKALLDIGGQPWIVKFPEGDPVDVPLVEHATMTLAQRAGIRTAETRPIALADGHAIAVRRFDREPGRRVHALSAGVALQAASDRLGYPELAQLLRRRGIVEGGIAAAQMQELFRRMVFNILLDNTDDHEKNHVVLLDDRNRMVLSPAFDVLPSGQALGYQQMRVGADDSDSTLANAMSMCTMFALKPDAAAREARRVCSIVDTWKTHFAACGVKPNDIDALGAQIDRPFLREQRAAF